MTDPVEITQQAAQTAQAMADSGPATHAGWAILGGIVLKVVEAIAKLFGSRKERAEAAATIVDAATDVIEAQREDTKRIRAERDLLAAERDAAFDERDSAQDSLRKLDARLTAQAALLVEHERCAPRQAAQAEQIAKQAREITTLNNQAEWMGRAYDALIAGKEPPPRPESITPRADEMPHPNEVRGRVPRKET
jgi:hypothetical protein